MCIRDRSKCYELPPPVSYTHLDVYKRQGVMTCRKSPLWPWPPGGGSS
ncbi:hypothetical protein [Streptomyces fragilis]|nr:hypothetical protein [Streptomyces fragilis]